MSTDGIELLQQDFGVAVNHRQQIVEVVRHAARQAAHRFHFLRLPELLFQLPPLGDVFGDQLEDLVRFIRTAGGVGHSAAP